MKLRFFMATALVGVVPLTAWAGGKVVLDVGTDGTSERNSMEFEFDGNRMRMNIPSTSDTSAYMLLRDGQAFTVINQGGQPMVMDMSTVGQMLGGMMDQSVNVGSEVNGLFSLEDTGRSETVAGIAGRVFMASYTDADGRSQTDEIVIGNHPQLREFSQTMSEWARTIASSFGNDAANMSHDESMALVYGKGDGILRFGDSYRVASVSDVSIVSSRFELPANSQQMPNLGGLISGQGGQEPAAEQGGGLGGMFGGMLGRQAERQAERQQNKAENRTEREVDGAVDRAFNRALDGLFGR